MGKFSDMPPEQRAEFGRKGGIASGEAKRRKKAMRERLQILLELSLKNGKKADVETVKSWADLRGRNITVEDAMMIKQIEKALNGDTQAAAFVRDTSGQSPSNNLSVGVTAENNLFQQIEESLNDLRQVQREAATDAALVEAEPSKEE